MFCAEPPKRLIQQCPLCGTDQVIMMRGLVHDMEDNSITMSADRGYSFCNCRNIFFTRYENIDKSIYDELYYERDKDNLSTVATKEIEKLFPILQRLNPNIKSFIELGSIHDHVLDYIKDKGIETTGLDIFQHAKKHSLIVTDFEYYEPDTTYDVVHASHIFEHFKSPGAMLEKCKSMLNEGGLLYIAMPDTFFIDFKGDKALDWDWYVNEHHILWNMEDFIEYCSEHRLKCLHKERGLDLFKQSDSKWLWKKDFKVVLTHA